MSRWIPKALRMTRAMEDVSARFDAIGTSDIDPAFFGFTSWESSVVATTKVDRRTAMQVPAVKRSVELVAGLLATLPIDLLGPDGLPSDFSPLMEQPEADKPRSITLARTFEDLMFEAVAWWQITKFGWHGYPTQVRHIDPCKVRVDESTETVYVEGKAVPDSELIRFYSPNKALLVAGARAIRTALNLDTAAANFADGVPPLDYFSPAEGADPAEDDDITALLDDWQKSRRSRSTGYVPAALKYNIAGWSPEQLQMADARQHAVLEIARLVGVDPEDLGVSTTSRTYQNAFDRKQARITDTLRGYMVAFEERLSMGDVTPRGYKARINVSDYLRSDDLTRVQVATQAVAGGLISPEEGRGYFDPSLPVSINQPAAQEVPTNG